MWIKLRLISILIFFGSCQKHFDFTDPQSDLPPTPLNNVIGGECKIVNIKQINGKLEFNRLSFQSDLNNKTIGIQFFDSTTNTVDLKTTFQYKSDTIICDSTSWMLKDHINSNILQFHIRKKLNNGTWDNIIYEYKYDETGRLTKKNTYYNQFIYPDFTTSYYYSGNNLISCEVIENSSLTKLLQTEFQYDLSIEIKPWLYLFGDAFENYKYMQGLTFGKKASNPIKQISTKIFDPNTGAVLENWQTAFSGYVFSSDKYVLQVDVWGDNQQGIGLLLGTMRFDYHCQ